MCEALTLSATPMQFADFPPMTFDQFERQLPPRDAQSLHIDTTPEPFASQVMLTGRTRRLPQEDRAFMEAINHSLGNSYTGLLALYRQEIEVTQGGRSYWLPVQEQVLSKLHEEVRPGDVFTVFVRFFGRHVGHQPLYLVIDYKEEEH